MMKRRRMRMSRPNPDYEKSFAGKFRRWVNGDYDPGKWKLESSVPDEEALDYERKKYVRVPLEKAREYDESRFEEGITRRIKGYNRFYRIIGVFAALFMIAILLWTVSYLPAFGDPDSPMINEVVTRYIEEGLSETGAVNIVAGMILDYRAFDTFGESCVLFVATCCVLILLRVDEDEPAYSRAALDMNDRHFEPHNDTILQWAARILVPIIIIFGVYVVLNGHISPGGGFSGGAIIGSGLILYLTAFGFKKTGRFMTNRVVKILTVSALTFYCIAKSYSFFTGANELYSIISPGTPGRILSAGLIVYLNICVGIVVACTMYTFYAMFRRGRL